MTGKTLIVTAVGTGCIVAAGAGSYLATSAARPAQEPEILLTTEAPASPARIAPEPAPLEAVLSPEEPTAVDVPAPPQAPKAEAAVPSEPVAEPVPEPEPEPLPPVAAVVQPVAAPPPARAIPRLPAPPEPEPDFLQFVIEEDAVIGIRLEDEVSSETAEVEDPVMARVSRDVIVDGRTVVPAGTWVEGHVTLVEKGGRFRDKAKLELRFTTLILTERDRLPVLTQAITREGESPTDEAASKIGASAVIGTILGAVIGGKKGAAIGSAAGAAGGTAAVASGNPNAATLAAGTPLTVRLAEPVTVLIERKRDE